ncbi:MAG: hypothetical protein V1898_00265 [Patescibacteria group bacterium]
MEVPYYFLGIIYIVVIFGFLIMAFFNLYHLIKYGFFDFTGKLNTFIFICAWLIIIGFTILFFWSVPWFDTFDLFADIIGEFTL